MSYVNQNSSNSNVTKKSTTGKDDPKVEKEGDGTADDVIRANISYVPGAESVQIQVKYWDEIKAYHVKSIEVDADQIAKVFQVFMRKLCSNSRPVNTFMETAESVKTKKEGRAGSNAYNGATGISPEDEIDEMSKKISDGYANGDPIEIISEYAARRNELIEKEVEEINGLRGESIL